MCLLFFALPSLVLVFFACSFRSLTHLSFFYASFFYHLSYLCTLQCAAAAAAARVGTVFTLRQALMAREAVLKFNPQARIVAHHGNVKEAQFGMAFIRKFDLVLNALDNIDARRYVCVCVIFLLLCVCV